MNTDVTIKKIAVIGPESTGKSSLCEGLAAHYGTVWVREYAREYLQQNGTEYKFEDLYHIAQGQLKAEDTALHELADAFRHSKKSVPLFSDTDLHVIKIWSEFVFNKCDNRILTEISKRKYDLYLLCNTDLPWVKDELREYPDIETREKLFLYYKEEMAAQKTPWVIISGLNQERLQSAIRAVNSVL